MKKIMQKWQWEVCKMFMYMAFPVACFHYFNSPQIFEDAVTKVKLKTFVSTPAEKREEIEDMIHKINLERQLKELDQFETKKK